MRVYFNVLIINDLLNTSLEGRLWGLSVIFHKL